MYVCMYVCIDSVNDVMFMCANVYMQFVTNRFCYKAFNGYHSGQSQQAMDFKRELQVLFEDRARMRTRGIEWRVERLLPANGSKQSCLIICMYVCVR